MKSSNNTNKRTGKSLEQKRIFPKRPDVMDSGKRENAPCDFNKEGRGQINYDPILGWIPVKYLGGETVGISYKHSTNHLKRVDGLPGSRA